MALKYDLNGIFADLEEQVKKTQKQYEEIDETKENESIESPEDAPQTQEVAPATSKTTEDIHGGDEASKEIKDSPNSVDDGEKPNKENKSKNTGKNGKGDVSGSGNKQSPNEKDEASKEIKDSLNSVYDGENPNKGNKSKNTKNTGKNGKGDVSGSGNKQSPNEKREGFGDKNLYKSNLKTTPEDLQQIVENLFKEKQRKQNQFKSKNKQEYLKKYIFEIIKKIAAQHAGIDKQDGSETYDKKQILQHMLKHQNYKLLGDKYDLRDARYVQFFIDTSGVYGCGSNKILHELIPIVINMLEKQGYECYIAACGNGFYKKDMVEDEYYNTRKTLENYKSGKVSKIACPTPQTAAKMANEAEFSVILADFDGLSSICEMANLCQQDKVPYFLCTEDRYPWEDPTLHDWVDPELCDYNAELVYDVSIDGNPTLEQYENENTQYYDDYEQYDDRDYND